MNKNILFGSIISLMALWGCTDLEEQVLDESLTGAGQAEAVSGAIAPAYGQVSNVWLHTRNFGLQLIASDEGILPYRGGTDWFDGGKFMEMHRHLTTPGNDLVADTWNDLARNISRCLSAIETLRPLSETGNNEATQALYEMIALRAYLNMLMLDSWGIVFQKESSNEVSQVLRREQAIEMFETARGEE